MVTEGGCWREERTDGSRLLHLDTGIFVNNLHVVAYVRPLWSCLPPHQAVRTLKTWSFWQVEFCVCSGGGFVFLSQHDHACNLGIYGAQVIFGLGIRRYPQMILVNETSKETEVSVYVFESECYLAVNKIIIIILLTVTYRRLTAESIQTHYLQFWMQFDAEVTVAKEQSTAVNTSDKIWLSKRAHAKKSC